MTSAYAKYLDTYERVKAGDMDAVARLADDAKAAAEELRPTIPDVTFWAEAKAAAKWDGMFKPEPMTEAEKLTAIADAEEFNRRNLEMLGMDPSRATELANAQRAALKENGHG